MLVYVKLELYFAVSFGRLGIFTELLDGSKLKFNIGLW